MTVWVELVEEVLTDLGGRTTCVPGAKLHTEVSKIGFRKSEDFGEYLRAQAVTFSQFLERNPKLTVHRRPGADVLVGFDGAILPVRTRGARDYTVLREDVYSAFTRISPNPYVYVPTTDLFTTQPGEAIDPVDVPAITLDDLLVQRKEFAKSLESEEARDGLTRSIERSPTPLISFQRTVNALGISRQWHDFKYRDVKASIEKWATEKGVAVSQGWFSQQSDIPPIESPQTILSELARHMTDEEIRSIAIPFRAVEELYRALPRRQG
jgi:hypothetical protein